MSSPCQFVKETVIDAGIDEVYAFHENPENVRQISPGWQRVAEVRARQTAVPGESFVLKIRLFGVIPLVWEGVWRTVEKPTLLVDEIVRGPFYSWRHEHRFRATGPSQTLMTDHVTYQFFPGALGRFFGETAGRLQFHFMFADRQARTRRWLREKR